MNDDGTIVSVLAFCGLISVVVFVLFSVPIFARTYSFLDFGFEVGPLFVASVSGALGLIHGLILGGLICIVRPNSLIVTCLLSFVATLIIIIGPLTYIWFRTPINRRSHSRNTCLAGQHSS
jgi:ribose/xylose/arabinose/galactoside ABC-type transport system permease subunit